MYELVEAGPSSPEEITRTAGLPKEDKFVILFKEAPADAGDATSLFKEGAPLGELALPIQAQ